MAAARMIRKFETFEDLKNAKDEIPTTKSHEEIGEEVKNFAKIARANIRRNIEKVDSNAPLGKTI